MFKNEFDNRLNSPDLDRYIRSEAIPKLQELSAQISPEADKALRGQLQRGFSLAFGGFIILFLIVQAILPENWWGITLTFLAFFGVFSV